MISGATTEMELSLPGRFSLPPTREGRAGLAALPAEEESSGVSELLRLAAAVEARGRFWPAVDLGRVADLGAGPDCFWDFLGAASGWGHSTSCVRSRREAGIHSSGCEYQETKRYVARRTVETFVEFFIVDTETASEIYM